MPALYGYGGTEAGRRSPSLKDVLLKEHPQAKWLDDNLLNAEYVLQKMVEHKIKEKEKNKKSKNFFLRKSPIEFSINSIEVEDVRKDKERYKDAVKSYLAEFDTLILVLNETNDNPDSLHFSFENNNVDFLLKLTKDVDINVVVVIFSSRALYIPRVFNHADAVVSLWRPGTEISPIAKLLFKDTQGNIQYDFSAKTPVSWPRYPCQYRDLAGTKSYYPLLKIGYGLNYSSINQPWIDHIESTNNCYNPRQES